VRSLEGKGSEKIKSDPSVRTQAGIRRFRQNGMLYENSRFSLRGDYRLRLAAALREGVNGKGTCRELQCR